MGDHLAGPWMIWRVATAEPTRAPYPVWAAAPLDALMQAHVQLDVRDREQAAERAKRAAGGSP